MRRTVTTADVVDSKNVLFLSAFSKRMGVVMMTETWKKTISTHFQDKSVSMTGMTFTWCRPQIWSIIKQHIIHHEMEILARGKPYICTVHPPASDCKVVNSWWWSKAKRVGKCNRPLCMFSYGQESKHIDLVTATTMNRNFFQTSWIGIMKEM